MRATPRLWPYNDNVSLTSATQWHFMVLKSIFSVFDIKHMTASSSVASVCRHWPAVLCVGACPTPRCQWTRHKEPRSRASKPCNELLLSRCSVCYQILESNRDVRCSKRIFELKEPTVGISFFLVERSLPFTRCCRTSKCLVLPAPAEAKCEEGSWMNAICRHSGFNHSRNPVLASNLTLCRLRGAMPASSSTTKNDCHSQKRLRHLDTFWSSLSFFEQTAGNQICMKQSW